MGYERDAPKILNSGSKNLHKSCFFLYLLAVMKFKNNYPKIEYSEAKFVQDTYINLD